MSTKTEIVACLGSSTTASKGTFKWMDALKNRSQNGRFQFVNLGVGGDLSYNGLERIQSVVDAKPDRVIVLIGANDILATVFPNALKFFGRWKKLPQQPSPEWFEQNIVGIVHELKQKTKARIALCSLAPIGEDPHAASGPQARLNALFAEYNQIIHRVAQNERISYIPFYEAFQKQLQNEPGKAFAQLSFRHLYKDYVWREFILRRSFDDISRMDGWRYHVDGIHLNTRGGMILVDAVQTFLDQK